MLLRKKKITELDAVAFFIMNLDDVIMRNWDEIHESVKNFSRDKHFVNNENRAMDAFFTANIALAMQQIKNLFPSGQAERLNMHMVSKSTGAFQAMVTRYYEVYARAVGSKKDPLTVMTSVLLLDWVGGAQEKLLAAPSTSKRLLTEYILELFLNRSHYWKIIKEKYKLTEQQPTWVQSIISLPSARHEVRA